MNLQLDYTYYYFRYEQESDRFFTAAWYRRYDEWKHNTSHIVIIRGKISGSKFGKLITIDQKNLESYVTLFTNKNMKPTSIHHVSKKHPTLIEELAAIVDKETLLIKLQE